MALEGVETTMSGLSASNELSCAISTSSLVKSVMTLTAVDEQLSLMSRLQLLHLFHSTSADSASMR
jgi:hypothetical protein